MGVHHSRNRLHDVIVDHDLIAALTIATAKCVLLQDGIITLLRRTTATRPDLWCTLEIAPVLAGAINDA